MRNLLKLILFVFPGMFGLVWNPFKRKGLSACQVDDAYVILFNLRRGFSAKDAKKQIKKLFKELGKYSKGQPKYLPEFLNPLDGVITMYFGCGLGYMKDTTWRLAAEEVISRPGRRSPGFLIVNVGMKIGPEMASDYPALDLYATEVTHQVNNHLLRSMIHYSVEAQDAYEAGYLKDIQPHLEENICDECEEVIHRLSIYGECFNCSNLIVEDRKLLNKLNKVYDKAATAASKAA